MYTISTVLGILIPVDALSTCSLSLEEFDVHVILLIGSEEMLELSTIDIKCHLLPEVILLSIAHTHHGVHGQRECGCLHILI